jgi:hypothetical protein
MAPSASSSFGGQRKLQHAHSLAHGEHITNQSQSTISSGGAGGGSRATTNRQQELSNNDSYFQQRVKEMLCNPSTNNRSRYVNNAGQNNAAVSPYFLSTNVFQKFPMIFLRNFSYLLDGIELSLHRKRKQLKATPRKWLSKQLLHCPYLLAAQQLIHAREPSIQTVS